VTGDEEGDGDGGRSDGNGDDADINKCFFIFIFSEINEQYYSQFVRSKHK